MVSITTPEDKILFAWTVVSLEQPLGALLFKGIDGMSEGLDTFKATTDISPAYKSSTKTKQNPSNKKSPEPKVEKQRTKNIMRLIKGDSAKVLQTIESDSIDLVVTSPPYADQRKGTYGGVHADHYVAWFLPIADELHRVLKPTGSFVLNIKERVVNGERHTYVMELIIAMRKRGWLYTEEYIWHKRNCYPGKWPNRFRDAWERCIHFTKQKKFAMYQESVMVPMGNWKNSRLKALSETDRVRDESKVGSGFGKKIENWIGRDWAYPANVLHLATECANRSHSAAFPESLPEWFIKLFTKPGDMILDPFSGSGTTMRVARNLERSSIGIEISDEYCELTAAELGLKKLKGGIYDTP